MSSKYSDKRVRLFKICSGLFTTSLPRTWRRDAALKGSSMLIDANHNSLPLPGYCQTDSAWWKRIKNMNMLVTRYTDVIKHKTTFAEVCICLHDYRMQRCRKEVFPFRKKGTIPGDGRPNNNNNIILLCLRKANKCLMKMILPWPEGLKVLMLIEVWNGQNRSEWRSPGSTQTVYLPYQACKSR